MGIDTGHMFSLVISIIGPFHGAGVKFDDFQIDVLVPIFLLSFRESSEASKYKFSSHLDHVKVV